MSLGALSKGEPRTPVVSSKPHYLGKQDTPAAGPSPSNSAPPLSTPAPPGPPSTPPFPPSTSLAGLPVADPPQPEGRTPLWNQAFITRPLPTNHAQEEVDLSFAQCMCSPAVKIDSAWQTELSDPNSVCVLEALPLLGAIFWDESFIPYPRHTFLLAKKLCLKTKNVTSTVAKERIEGIPGMIITFYERKDVAERFSVSERKDKPCKDQQLRLRRRILLLNISKPDDEFEQT
ncbi:hypothetical protein MMC31_001869 [Peltigera leucophlebia]|nr:hypothetical protein [Peltigera leucophlebia]